MKCGEGMVEKPGSLEESSNWLVSTLHTFVVTLVAIKILNYRSFVMIIAIQECSAGNESSGSNWLETKVFDERSSIGVVLNWSKSLSGFKGRLILSKPQNSEENFDSQPTDKGQNKTPCSPGCQGHVSHPCEKCGQQWG